MPLKINSSNMAGATATTIIVAKKDFPSINMPTFSVIVLGIIRFIKRFKKLMSGCINIDIPIIKNIFGIDKGFKDRISSGDF